MMAYDLRGGWNPSNGGPHPPLLLFRGFHELLAKSRCRGGTLDLGTTFYGYAYLHPALTAALTYNQIVALNPENAQHDTYGEVFYNGIATIIEKTELAMAELSGVMIWELGQDHFGDLLLLKAIHTTIYGGSVSATDQYFVKTQIYHNRFEEEINIKFERSVDYLEVEVFTIDGKLLKAYKGGSAGAHRLILEGWLAAPMF